MTIKLSTHNVEQMARAAVMYQLAARGYNCQLTDSRFPSADLLVHSPSGETFSIDVKGQRTKNFWRMREPRPGIYYVLVYVTSQVPRIFVLDPKSASTLYHNYKNRIQSTGRKEYADGHWGFNWTDPHPNEDRYDLLPE